MRVTRHGAVTLHDYDPKVAGLAEDVLAGLRADPPHISSKYFYDEAGSALFTRITEQPEYYLTRTELAIMDAHIDEMAALLGPRCAVVEPGSGSGVKTRLLLSHLVDPVAYVPVDISGELLIETAQLLNAEFPALEVLPVRADYFDDWELPPMQRPPARCVVYFPGSTIGNMEPHEARQFLRRLAKVAGPCGALLVGVDLRKDPAVIAAAYDDSAGVTALFNLNLIERINRELKAGIPAGAFGHNTRYDEEAGRNESHLVALQDLEVIVAGETVQVPVGTRILVEHSYKYSLEGFARLAAGAGLAVQRVWTDPGQLFSVQYLVPEAPVQ